MPNSKNNNSSNNIPEENNFYASFRDVSKASLKDLLNKNKWAVRKVGWTDFEFYNSWSELILEGDEQEPLLNGRVAYNENNILLLDNFFEKLGGQYNYEFYDRNKNLIIEKKNAG